MDLEVKYQGKVATTDDIEFIKELIAENPCDSRRSLSKKLCKAWNWVQPNGALRDMVCRGFLLRLEKAAPIDQHTYLIQYNYEPSGGCCLVLQPAPFFGIHLNGFHN